MKNYNQKLQRRLWLGLTLLAGFFAITAGLYLYHARQHLGSNYTALVADVIRPQLHTAIMRTTLNDLSERPQDAQLIDRLDNLFWRIPQHIHGVEFGLRKAKFLPTDYHVPLDQLLRIEEELPILRQSLEDILAGASPNNFIQQALAVENDLAQAYSSLSELLHSEAAKQRLVLDRLAAGTAILVLFTLLLSGGLIFSLIRLNHQHNRVTKLSLTDELTGLYNRRYMLNITENLFKENNHCKSLLSMALLDLDYFKRINDQFGHPIGDRVLKGCADILRREVRGSDIVARLGGEEFCILMPNTDTHSALEVTERVRSRIASMTQHELGVPISITVSLGLATAIYHQTSFDELYSLADKALYQAKSHGRNCIKLANKNF